MSLTVDQMSTITKEILLNLPPSVTTEEALEHRRQVEVELAEMRAKGIAPDLPYDFDDLGDDLDIQEQAPSEPDALPPLAVEPPLTLAKIRSHLSMDERLWLARMIAAYGEEEVLRMWPSYEVQINFARSL
jgi:hypothetical protein